MVFNDKLLFSNGDSKWKEPEPVEIIFKDNFQVSDDIFNLGRIDFKQYISERLKTELEKNKITGIRYAESLLFE